MTNNERLKALIADNTLTNAAIAGILDTSIHSVNSWTCQPGTVSYRVMPAIKLKYLELLIKAQTKKVMK